MRKVHLLPNLLTLANAFCGLLAICKGIDALQVGLTDPATCTSVYKDAAGKRSHRTSRTFSPPRIPVSQS
jgi:hypothetical protein